MGKVINLVEPNKKKDNDSCCAIEGPRHYGNLTLTDKDVEGVDVTIKDVISGKVTLSCTGISRDWSDKTKYRYEFSIDKIELPKSAKGKSKNSDLLMEDEDDEY